MSTYVAASEFWHGDFRSTIMFAIGWNLRSTYWSDYLHIALHKKLQKESSLQTLKAHKKWHPIIKQESTEISHLTFYIWTLTPGGPAWSPLNEKKKEIGLEKNVFLEPAALHENLPLVRAIPDNNNSLFRSCSLWGAKECSETLERCAGRGCRCVFSHTSIIISP